MPEVTIRSADAFNRGRAASYDAVVTDLAYGRTASFLRYHLGL